MHALIHLIASLVTADSPLFQQYYVMYDSIQIHHSPSSFPLLSAGHLCSLTRLLLEYQFAVTLHVTMAGTSGYCAAALSSASSSSVAPPARPPAHYAPVLNSTTGNCTTANSPSVVVVVGGGGGCRRCGDAVSTGNDAVSCCGGPSCSDCSSGASKRDGEAGTPTATYPSRIYHFSGTTATSPVLLSPKAAALLASRAALEELRGRVETSLAQFFAAFQSARLQLFYLSYTPPTTPYITPAGNAGGEPSGTRGVYADDVDSVRAAGTALERGYVSSRSQVASTSPLRRRGERPSDSSRGSIDGGGGTGPAIVSRGGVDRDELAAGEGSGEAFRSASLLVPTPSSANAAMSSPASSSSASSSSSSSGSRTTLSGGAYEGEERGADRDFDPSAAVGGAGVADSSAGFNDLEGEEGSFIDDRGDRRPLLPRSSNNINAGGGGARNRRAATPPSSTLSSSAQEPPLGDLEWHATETIAVSAFLFSVLRYAQTLLAAADVCCPPLPLPLPLQQPLEHQPAHVEVVVVEGGGRQSIYPPNNSRRPSTVLPMPMSMMMSSSSPAGDVELTRVGRHETAAVAVSAPLIFVGSSSSTLAISNSSTTLPTGTNAAVSPHHINSAAVTDTTTPSISQPSGKVTATPLPAAPSSLAGGDSSSGAASINAVESSSFTSASGLFDSRTGSIGTSEGGPITLDAALPSSVSTPIAVNPSTLPHSHSASTPATSRPPPTLPILTYLSTLGPSSTRPSSSTGPVALHSSPSSSSPTPHPSHVDQNHKHPHHLSQPLPQQLLSQQQHQHRHSPAASTMPAPLATPSASSSSLAAAASRRASAIRTGGSDPLFLREARENGTMGPGSGGGGGFPFYESARPGTPPPASSARGLGIATTAAGSAGSRAVASTSRGQSGSANTPRATYSRSTAGAATEYNAAGSAAVEMTDMPASRRSSGTQGAQITNAPAETDTDGGTAVVRLPRQQLADVHVASQWFVAPGSHAPSVIARANSSGIGAGERTAALVHATSIARAAQLGRPFVSEGEPASARPSSPSTSLSPATSLLPSVRAACGRLFSCARGRERGVAGCVPSVSVPQLKRATRVTLAVSSTTVVSGCG